MHFTASGFTISLSGTHCSSLQVDQIDSALIPQSSGADSRAGVSVKLNGISFSCSIAHLNVQHATVWPLGPIKADGEASFGVSGTAFNSNVLLTEKDGLAVASDLSDDTSLHIETLDLHLEGNVWVKIASLFEGILHDYLKNKLLPTEIVKVVSGLVHTNGTQALGVLDQWVLSLPYAPLPEPSLPAAALDWRQSDALAMADYILNDVVGCRGPLGLDAIVDSLTDRSGAVSVNASSIVPTIRVEVPGLATVAVDVGMVNISGLDEFSLFKLLVPNASAAERHSLHSTATSASFAASLDVRVNVTPAGEKLHGSSLVEDFRLAVKAKATTLDATLLVGVNRTALASLDALSALQPGCLARTLLPSAVGVRSLELHTSLDGIAVLARGGGLELGVDTLLDNALLLLTDSFAASIPKAINGVFGGPIRGMLDGVLKRAVASLTNSTCVAPPPPAPPPPPPPSSDFVDWRKSELLGLLDYVVDDVVGARGPLGTNAIVRALTGGSGDMALNLSASLPAVSIAVPGVATIMLQLGELRISGLDAISELQLLTADETDATALESAAKMPVLNASVGISVRVLPRRANAAETVLPLELRASLRAVDVHAAITLALNGTGLASFKPAQYVNPACIAQEVAIAAVASLGASARLGGLSVSRQDHVATFTAPHDLLLDLPASLTKRLLGEANTYLASALAHMRLGGCAPAPPAPSPSPLPRSSDYVDWRESVAIKLIDFVTEDAVASFGGLPAVVDALTGDTGAVSLNLSALIPADAVSVAIGGVARVGVDFGMLTLSGLESLRTLSPLDADATDGVVLTSAAHMDTLNASLTLHVRVTTEAQTASQTATASQLPVSAEQRAGKEKAAPVVTLLPLTLAADLASVGVRAAMRLALNQSSLNSLQLRQLVNSSCLAHTLVLAQLTKLELGASVRALSVRADKGEAASLALPHALTLSIPRSLETWLVGSLNAMSDGVVRRWQRGECAPASWPPPSVVDWRRSPLVSSASRALAEFGADGVNGLMDKLSRLAGFPNGTLGLPAGLDAFSVRTVDELVGPLVLRASQFSISGLDSLFDMALLQPDESDPTLLHFNLGFGGARPLAISTDLVVQLAGETHEFDVILALRDAMLHVDTRIEIDEAALGSMPMLATLLDPASLLCTLNEISISSDSKISLLSARGGRAHLSVGSRKQRTLATVSSASSSLATLGVLQPGLVTMLNDEMHTRLKRAKAPCAAPPPPPPPFAPPPPALVLTVGVPLVSVTAFVLLTTLLLGVWGCIRRWRWHSRLRRALLRHDALGPSLDAQTDEAVDDKPMESWHAASDSLSSNPQFRCIKYRVGIPSLIFFAMATFVAAHVYPGATVHVFATVAGERVRMPRIFEFTLVSSVVNMWKGEAYLLALLIALLSGAWPYAKLVLMLIAWWAPGAVLSPYYRERFLRALDALGKWSLIDFLMLMMMMVTFSVKAGVASTDGGDGDSDDGVYPAGYDAATADVARVRVEVLPGLGILAFLAAAGLSLVLSHVLLAMQRRATAVAADTDGDHALEAGMLGADNTNSARESHAHNRALSHSRLSGHLVSPLAAPPITANGENGAGTGTGSGGNNIDAVNDCGGVGGVERPPQGSARTPLRRIHFTRLCFFREVPLSTCMQIGVVMLLLLCLAAFLAAAATDAFSLRISGLAGAVLPANETNTPYSLLSMARAIGDASPHAPAATMYFLQGVFYTLCFFMPLLWLSLLFLVWLLPMSRKQRHRLVAVTEVLHAWSAIDVFMLMVIASRLELNRFAHFLVGHECDGINGAMRRYYADVVPHAEEGCFGANLTVTAGFALLFVASFLCMATGNFIMYAANAAHEQTVE